MKGRTVSNNHPLSLIQNSKSYLPTPFLWGLYFPLKPYLSEIATHLPFIFVNLLSSSHPIMLHFSTDLVYLVGLLFIILPIFWGVGLTLKEGISQLKRLHSIPCSQCAFFTGDYRLKCTVHPITALSEEAIGCCDYEPRSKPMCPYAQSWTRLHK